MDKGGGGGGGKGLQNQGSNFERQTQGKIIVIDIFTLCKNSQYELISFVASLKKYIISVF